MKLELKHLAGYLPYGLKIYWEDFEKNTKVPWELKGHNIDFAIENKNKPILRQLSDLTKEIEVNGEKFVPIEELYKIQWDGTHHLSDKNKYYTVDLGLFAKCSHNSTAMETSINIKYPLNNNYWKIEKLLEWHFDIHNLIENNLEININTL